jgi:hypothetical protein
VTGRASRPASGRGLPSSAPSSEAATSRRYVGRGMSLSRLGSDLMMYWRVRCWILRLGLRRGDEGQGPERGADQARVGPQWRPPARVRALPPKRSPVQRHVDARGGGGAGGDMRAEESAAGRPRQRRLLADHVGQGVEGGKVDGERRRRGQLCKSMERQAWRWHCASCGRGRVQCG